MSLQFQNRGNHRLYRYCEQVWNNSRLIDIIWHCSAYYIASILRLIHSYYYKFSTPLTTPPPPQPKKVGRGVVLRIIQAFKLFLNDFQMPKKHRALPDHVWKERVKRFATGDYKFGRGENPSKTTKWHAEIEKAKKCPLFGQPAAAGQIRLLSGVTVRCTCGYHLDLGVICFY